MYTRVQKWGNSKAVRLPKYIVEEAGIKENDPVELYIHEGNIIIVPGKKHVKLEDRVAEFEGKYRPDEWDTGEPEGDEVW
ncbi:MAG: AbrB/MazE/SpoVT family DNA-binding domain-containing protein [Bacillota bacterium]